jgi:hypothetical protein
MKNVFNIASNVQFIWFRLYFINGNYKPLGSNFMFGLLIASRIISIFVFWQTIKSK